MEKCSQVLLKLKNSLGNLTKQILSNFLNYFLVLD
jgi:hypothetical protein